ncbi:MAG: HAMP domain-containing sensor histidine kinase [Coriobacteriia bacterium]|nr:HAMP domain-containing sensor histidine kinase [Coriobacteriia bacterium]
MQTYFAPAERADALELQREIGAVNASLIMDTLLHSVSGMVAILNEYRQVVAFNDTLVGALGIDDPASALGLRPGEVLQCVHAHDEPGGCGTSKHCATCGAAVALVAALGLDEPAERVCALTTNRDGRDVDTCLLVRANPIPIDGGRFLFLFLKDVTIEWNRAALDRTFFHDINNMLGGLITASSLLANGTDDPELVRIIHQSATRVAREVAIQSSLRAGESSLLETRPEQTTVGRVLGELGDLFANHPTATDKIVRLREPVSDVEIRTDVSLLLRILANMVTNALEASAVREHIEVWAEVATGRVDFCVWNRQVIPESVALRVFQRNFSTKEGDGRGFGTYSMKLLGEQRLGASVSFTSTIADGTVFRLSLPRRSLT